MSQIQVPKGWEIQTLETLADVLDPHPSHRAPPRFEGNGGFPFIGIGNITEDGIMDMVNSRKVPEKYVLDQEKSYQINEHTIGYARVATVGKVVKIRKHKFRFAISATLSVINPHSINSDFLRYELKSKIFSQQVNNKTTGSTRQSLGIKLLRKMEIVYPKDEKTQQKIVQKLDDKFNEMKKYEQQITSIEAKLQHTKKSLDLLTSSVLNSAFSGKLN